jgi:hypothetical protein
VLAAVVAVGVFIIVGVVVVGEWLWWLVVGDCGGDTDDMNPVCQMRCLTRPFAFTVQRRAT